MILSGKEIIKQVEEGKIYIENFKPEKVNPNSYNLTLNPKMKVYKIDPSKGYVDSKAKPELEEVIIPEDGYVLEPGKFYLAATNEYTKTIGYIPMIDGRSSFARLGVQVHMTAGFGDVGFEGTFTLEIATMQPVKIYPNQEICQIYYQTIAGDPSIVYTGKYARSRETVGCRLYTE